VESHEGKMGVVMSNADDFRKYAREALRGAAESNSDQEQQTLVKLARTWSQAARRADGIPALAENQTEFHLETEGPQGPAGY
jgi:hypothetical protein